MLQSRFVAGMLTSVLTVLTAGPVPAQDYPSKPIRIITAAAGGGSDFDARLIAQIMSGPLGQSVVIDNRANGTVAGEVVSNSPPDGYTVLVTGGGFWTISLLRKVPYDAVRDFLPISLIERTVNIVAVHPSIPAKSIKELIALAKARPGELNYSFGSVGGAPHLASELFKSMAGVNIVHVMYRGNPPALTALISGEVQMTILDVGLIAPHVKSGKLRALAVTSAEPTTLAPGLPTVAASGLPGYESTGLTGVFAPAKTPAPIVTRLNQEIVRVLARSDVKEKLLSVGSEVMSSTPEQFGAIVRDDIARLGKVIKDAGIKAE